MAPTIVLSVLVGIPLIELLLFLEVGNHVGVFTIIFVIVVTAASGIALAKKQGIKALKATKASVSAGEFPVHEALNSVGILIAALLLFIPGFFTDSIGLCLFIPQVRVILLRKLLMSFVNKIKNNNIKQSSMGHSDPRHGLVIDGEVKSAENKPISTKN
jgi:UPF0716 protein FxsA